MSAVLENEATPMNPFCPEFSAYWLATPESAGERQSIESASGDQGLSPAQQVALEELAECVSAARSVV
jgi:hypothetical protein